MEGRWFQGPMLVNMLTSYSPALHWPLWAQGTRNTQAQLSWGSNTHPLGNGTTSRALPLLPCVDDLLDPDSFPLFSIPREETEATSAW